jgi:transcriptional regulator with XRE-family HTH domain/quercetin dioxygenase-like cupin family protein
VIHIRTMSPASPESVQAATARIGQRLRSVRTARKMRVSEIARETGVSSSMISQLERGQSRPSVGTLFAIARVLEVPVDTFFAADGASIDAEFSEADAPAERRFFGDGAQPPASTPAAAALVSEAKDVVRAANRAALDIKGGIRWERLTSTAIDGVEFLELVYEPGAESDKNAYSHSGIEMLLITQGVMTIFLGFEQHELTAGDSFAFESSTPHRYVNSSASETRAVTVILR